MRSSTDERKPLKAFCVRTKSLIEDCLKDAGLRFQYVQERVKERGKLRTKYLDPKKNYTGLDDITDQAALRVITYYDDDVDRAADVIKREFTVIPEKSVDKRETEPDRFGYYALNLICTHSEKRKSDVQFKNYADVVFEIQVTSVLRHAWSEIEHEWYDLKETYPPQIKRRFYRLAALLEIAETEFLDLRKLKTDYRRSVDVQVEAEVSDVPVNALSLDAFISREPLVARIDERVAAIRGVPLTDPLAGALEHAESLANAAGLTTLQTLRDSLRKHEADVLEYVERCQQIWGPPRQGSTLPRGACIHPLAVMLIAVQGGEDMVLEAIKAAGITRPPTFNVSAQVAVARDVLAKHPG